MTTTPRVLRQGKTLEDTPTTQYTATNCKAIVDGCSLVNYGAGAITFSMNLVVSGGSAGSENLIIKDRSVAAGATDLLPELRGRRFDAGDFLVTDTSAGATVAFRMEGREFTGT